MEHLLIQGGEIWLPFARGRIRALKAAGLEYASQKFDMGDGSVVKVRYTPWDEYIDIQGTYTSYLIKHESTDVGDDYLLPSKPEFKAKKNGKDLDAGVMDWRGKGGRYLTYNPGTFQRYRLATKKQSIDNFTQGNAVIKAGTGIWSSGLKIETPFSVVAAAIRTYALMRRKNSVSRRIELRTNSLADEKTDPPAYSPFRYTQVALYRSQSPVNARKCLISIGIDFR